MRTCIPAYLLFGLMLFSSLAASSGEAERLHESEIRALCEQLGSDDASVRSKADKRLRLLGEDATVHLKEAARSTNVQRATQAGLILGDFEAVKVLLDELSGDLIRTLYYESPTKTQAALAAQGETAVPFLAQRIKTEQDPIYRFNCVSVLNQIGGAAAISVLRVLAQDKHYWARTESIWALGNASDKESLPVLKEAWKNDPELSVKNEARIALCKIVGIRTFKAEHGETGMDKEIPDVVRAELDRVLRHYLDHGKHVDAEPVPTRLWIAGGQGVVKNVKVPSDIDLALGHKPFRTVKPEGNDAERWVLFNPED